MKLFTISHSNFIKVNSRNIDFKNFLGHIWKPEAYYKNQLFKEVWTKKRPGLLRQYIAEVALTQAHQGQKTSVIEVTPAMTLSSPVQLTPTMTHSSPVQVIPEMTPASPVQVIPAMTLTSPVQVTAAMTPASLSLSPSILVPHWLEEQTPQTVSPAASEHLDRNFQSIWSIESSPLSTESSTSSESTSSGRLSLPFGVVQPGSPYPDYQIRKCSIHTPHISFLILDPRIVTFTKEPSGMFKVLGSGVSGSVYHASLLSSGYQLAVKLYHQAELVPHTIVNEGMIMALLQNTGVVPKFFGVLQEPGDIQKFTLVQEFFGDGMTLYKLIGMMNKHQITLNEKETITLCYRLVHALKVIHSRGVLVNDLKNDNVLVDVSNKEFNIRYIDFGLATFGVGMTYEKSYEPNSDIKYSFLAPEVRQGDNPTCVAADIYSLGILIGEIGWRIDELEDISERCTDQVALARPSMDELVMMMDGLVNLTN
ncbi:Serine/threonine-protein kinase CLA4 [Mizuhopecten yessoensis]|uniref:Serine/threonine-protein kinase CLA4 n=1 Tax=Mizuhopecten yessoensis TaxID=6573 RepID=A0A210Q0I8_MIZYE|nr:Serine/threonine-protein kinase CLA4 [Mizuhopecten yessoensis]